MSEKSEVIKVLHYDSNGARTSSQTITLFSNGYGTSEIYGGSEICIIRWRHRNPSLRERTAVTLGLNRDPFFYCFDLEDAKLIDPNHDDRVFRHLSKERNEEIKLQIRGLEKVIK
jgi:hypothetical protein